MTAEDGVVGFHQANRGMKLKQLHPAQIPPETKREGVNAVYHKTEAQPPKPNQPKEKKTTGVMMGKQRNDVTRREEAESQPNASPASPSHKEQA